MKAYKILIVVLMLITSIVVGCKTPKTMEQPLNSGHYLVHLNEGYNQFDLRELLKGKVDKILPSSKTENVFLIHASEEGEDLVKFLEGNKAVLSVKSADYKEEKPTNGTNKDMKKTKRLDDM